MMLLGFYLFFFLVIFFFMMFIGFFGLVFLFSGFNFYMLYSNFNSKYICVICGDRVFGKYYGVYRYIFKIIYCIRCYVMIFIF